MLQVFERRILRPRPRGHSLEDKYESKITSSFRDAEIVKTIKLGRLMEKEVNQVQGRLE